VFGSNSGGSVLVVVGASVDVVVVLLILMMQLLQIKVRVVVVVVMVVVVVVVVLVVVVVVVLVVGMSGVSSAMGGSVTGGPYVKLQLLHMTVLFFVELQSAVVLDPSEGISVVKTLVVSPSMLVIVVDVVTVSGS